MVLQTKEENKQRQVYNFFSAKMRRISCFFSASNVLYGLKEKTVIL